MPKANGAVPNKVKTAGDHPMPRRAKEEMRRESPDGMPPALGIRGISRGILIGGILLAAAVGVVAAARWADSPESVLLLGGIVLLVALIGGLPAMFAGILRWRDRRHAEGEG